ITTEQNFRYLPSAKLGGARVLRRFQESLPKTVIERGLFIPEHTRDQPHNCIYQNHGRDCTISQDIVSDGNFLIDQVFNDSMIHPFVMPADDDQMRLRRNLSRQILIKASSRR